MGGVLPPVISPVTAYPELISAALSPHHSSLRPPRRIPACAVPSVRLPEVAREPSEAVIEEILTAACSPCSSKGNWNDWLAVCLTYWRQSCYHDVQVHSVFSSCCRTVTVCTICKNLKRFALKFTLLIVTSEGMLLDEYDWLWLQVTILEM